MSETKTRKTRPAAIYPATPDSLSSINGNYIKAYLADNFQKGNITRKELETLNKRYSALAKEYGVPGFFHHFRREFAEKYFPQLAAKANPANKGNFDDFITSLLASK